MQSEDMERVCRVRRAILLAMKDYVTADLDEVKNHPAIERAQVSTAELVEQWNALSVGDAYITALKEFNGQRKAINERGLKQITQFAEREIFIWGKDGTRG